MGVIVGVEVGITELNGGVDKTEDVGLREEGKTDEGLELGVA